MNDMDGIEGHMAKNNLIINTYPKDKNLFKLIFKCLISYFVLN